jgi:hypothetical protein
LIRTLGDDGRKVTRELFQVLVPQELQLRQILGEEQYAAGE